MGAILTVEAGHEADVRAYLDARETDQYGYVLTEIEVFRLDGTRVEPPVSAYVYPAGLAPAWIGPLPIDEVAQRILGAARPLVNMAYAMNMAVNLSKLARQPHERDRYLDALADALYVEADIG